MCSRHYDRWKAHGDARPEMARYARDSVPADVRFWRFVDKAGPLPASNPTLGNCWIWTGATSKTGYGYFGIAKGQMSLAHRFAVGDRAIGMEVDHLCYVRNCVRPEHLDVVSHADNVARQRSYGTGLKSECIHGHPFDEQNTRVLKNGARACRTCTRDAMRRWRARHT